MAFDKVVIRFQICIFDTLNTADRSKKKYGVVVIRFQICIFDTLNTAANQRRPRLLSL